MANDDSPKTALEAQIDEERKELEAVPKVPIRQFYGTHARCHICGQLYDPEQGIPFDTHIHHSLVRHKCPTCGGATYGR